MTTKIDFTVITENVDTKDIVVFFKPLGCATFRTYIPEKHENRKDILELLTTTCTRFRSGVWIYEPDDQYLVYYASRYLEETLNETAIVVEPDVAQLN